jgi:hypothetical protein
VKLLTLKAAMAMAFEYTNLIVKLTTIWSAIVHGYHLTYAL